MRGEEGCEGGGGGVRGRRGCEGGGGGVRGRVLIGLTITPRVKEEDYVNVLLHHHHVTSPVQSEHHVVPSNRPMTSSAKPNSRPQSYICKNTYQTKWYWAPCVP